MTNKLAELFHSIRPKTGTSRISETVVRAAEITNDYVIFITPRSGSTFLTHALKNTQSLGYPDEWFNHSSIGNLVDKFGVDNIRDYLSCLKDCFSSQNGVFGFEISWPQYVFLSELVTPKDFFKPNTKWFYLRRRNIVAQSISLYTAQQSKIFHSYQLASDEVRDAPIVEYSAKEIMKYINLLISQETRIEENFRNMSIAPIQLFYEDITSNEIETVNLFRNVLGVDACPTKSDNPIKKLAIVDSQSMERRFRDENEQFLERVKERRPEVSIQTRMV